MKFQSTRSDGKIRYSSAQVIKQGLADDGGLFVPEYIPTLSYDEISSFCSLSYPELAATILSKFLTDYSYDELLEDAKNAYTHDGFDCENACALKKVDENTFALELWHGPTCAFKDMALQIMPRLLSRALTKTNEDRTALVLVATSGDTGKAALEGYKNIDRFKIVVFYPQNGVSVIQKLQMVTQDGNNVDVCAVDGNFDDIQTGVKNIFSDSDIAKELSENGYFFSSANSINFGRLAPQIVYYVHAYCEMLKQEEISLGEAINVCVPTGNFGNILAAYIAKLMGLPINKLICASNSNNILTDFLTTGRYDRNRDFHLTISPSMDILISSNLERLLYMVAGHKKTCEWMKSLNINGYYEVDDGTLSVIKENFAGYYADEDKTRHTINNSFSNLNYLMDTHTAVAFSALSDYRNETNDTTKAIVASTASPYKFAKDVIGALSNNASIDEVDVLEKLSVATDTHIPKPLSNLDKRSINFSCVCTPEEMKEYVLNFIKK